MFPISDTISDTDHPEFQEDLKFSLVKTKRAFDQKLAVKNYEKIRKIQRYVRQKLNNQTKINKQLKKAAKQGINKIQITTWRTETFSPLRGVKWNDQWEILKQCIDDKLLQEFTKDIYGEHFELRLDSGFMLGPISAIWLAWEDPSKLNKRYKR